MTEPATERASFFSQLNQLVANRSWLRASRANLISRQKPQIGLRLVSRAAVGFAPRATEQLQLMQRPARFGPVRT